MTAADDTAAVPVTGGGLLRSLDIPSAAAAERARGESAGMLTAEETGLLTALVRATWRGTGAIVDGGSFLGSSLLAEARGLAQGGAAWSPGDFPGGRPIHGFELGRHPAPRQPGRERVRRYGEVEYALGESFVPELEQNIAEHRQLIQLHIGDLTEQHWSGTPIEVAFIDVCKTAELNAHVSREFLPSLLPEGSTLVHQDFFFDLLPWIRVTMGYLADHFVWEGQVATSSVYRLVSAVPPEKAAYDPFTEGTLAECLAFHDAVTFTGIDRPTQLMLALSRVNLILEKGSPREALAMLMDAAVAYADVAGSRSADDSYQPQPGTPEAHLPRRRLDKTVGRVLTRLAAEESPAGVESGPQGPSDRPPSDLDRVRAALTRRDFGEARRILQTVDEHDPRGTRGLLRARTEFEAGDLAQASRLIEELLARRPRHPRGLALRARLRLLAGDHEGASADARRAIGINPRLVAARRVLFDLDIAERLRR